MAKKRMGYEYLLYIGTAGSTAGTQVTKAKDVTYNRANQYGDTTVRGTGSAVPIGTQDIVRIDPEVTFNMVNDDGDSVLATIMAAAATGTSIAIRCIEISGGKGYDGDMKVQVNQEAPLGGEQNVAFTCVATDDSGRSPSLWV